MVRPLAVLCVLLAAVASPPPPAAASADLDTEPRSSYVVHVAPAHAPLLSSSPRVLARAYSSFLRDHLPMQILHPAPRVLYAYAHAATGFAAVMTERQAEHLSSQPSVVLAVVPDEMMQLHTTLTPSFLHLSPSSGVLQLGKGGKDIVIGVIDTGVYPKDRASFAAGPAYPPKPPTFRGGCVSTPAFNATKYCNKKLVGAKFFFKGYEAAIGHPIDEKQESKSPLDTNGHGTHTASTAAGAAVPNASFFNYAKGTAVGMAPQAHIAAYKVCWKLGCFGADILAAFEEAIKDRVNIISISIGATGQAPNFFQDTTAIGAFRAVRNNILVSASAGNSGPGEFTAVNVAPWILTVGASTVNRRFPADAVLGDGKTLVGTSLYAGPPLGPTKRPLVYGGNVGSSVCQPGKLNAGLVAGKIVLCDAGVVGSAAKGAAVKLAGGAGAIIAGNAAWGEFALTAQHIIPATDVTFADGQKIRTYITSTRSPVATIIFRGTVVGPTPSSPRMASFSSRGPNLRAREILKPDVTAPGVDILAAWTGENSPSQLDVDPRRVPFNIISGTSMSCPHVSGLAALLRDAHLTWSPAAIKSALMTTAYNVDNAGAVIRDMATGAESTPFVRGAGHVDPNRAADPGLVYDATADNYVSFLCAIGYTPQQIAIFTNDGSVTNCTTKKKPVGDLNYPAFSAVFRTVTDKATQHRVVRNVGANVKATYTATVTSPAGVVVTVKPQKLEFDATHRTLGYEITFAASGPRVATKYSFGSIVWSDGKHKVTSPIAITWPATPLAEM